MATYKHNNFQGYTLLEAVIGLSIFVVIVVPLLSHMFGYNRVRECESRITATCLLEQESKLALQSPDSIQIEKKRTINKEEWLITTSHEGNEFVRYDMKAVFRGKIQGEVIFYGSASK